MEEGIYDYENCVGCHRSGDEEEAGYLWRQRRKTQGEAEKGEQRPSHEHEEDERHDDD